MNGRWAVKRVAQLTRLLTVALSLASFRADAADGSWVEIKSPHVIVASDGSDATARTIAWQFEQLQVAMKTVCPWTRPDLFLPMLVLAPADEGGMKTLAPGAWEQANTNRPTSANAPFALDRYYTAVRADLASQVDRDTTPHFTAYSAFALAYLQPPVRGGLPLWFSRGLASVFANTQITETDIGVGRVIPSRLRLLRSGGVQRLGLRELLKVDRNSPSGTFGSPLFNAFDAESWAFVHFLLIADKGSHRKPLDDFVALVLAGTPISLAQDKAFANLDEVEPAFLAFLERGTFEPMHITADASVDRQRFTARPWTLVDAKAHQALFLTAMNRPTEARALAKEVQDLEPARPEPYEVEGMLADREHEEQVARAGYEKAIELGSTNLYALGRVANMLRSIDVIVAGGPNRATLIRASQLLERAAALRPYSLAHLQLGELYLFELRQPLAALLPLQRAVELEPTVSSVHLSLAQALWAVPLPQEARAEARRGLELANTEVDRAQAQRLIAEYAR